MSIHNNYARMEKEDEKMAQHVDRMYNLISDYAKENNIDIANDDRAEVLVEAIATYIVESKEK